MGTQSGLAPRLVLNLSLVFLLGLSSATFCSAGSGTSAG